MRVLRSAVVVALLAAAAGAQGADTAQLTLQARQVVKRYASQLKGRLGAALSNGGAAGAIDVCRDQAPKVAVTVGAQTGWTVGRTSLKLRNPANRPDPWETAGLQALEARLAAGTDPGTLEVAEVVEADGHRMFRYLKAIPTAPVCLGCHGPSVAPAVADALERDYPEDRATGFRAGELRGAFTLTKTME